MSQQLSTGAGRLNDVTVTPECARLFYRTFMFGASVIAGDEARRPGLENEMWVAFHEVDPEGPFKPFIAELKRIAGIGSAA